MKKCPYCGHENDEQTKVCERCKAGIPRDKNLPDSTKEISVKAESGKRKRSE